MYNPPRPKKEEFSLGNLSLKKARNFTYSTAFMAFLTVGTAFFMTLHTLQDRDREVSKAAVRRSRDGQRVVVVGGGAGGAALAGLVTATSPQVQVTVIEQDRKQTFHALEPHAHVGHRSYDLNTTGGYDSLRSPATWNMTRDATLVMGKVVRVDPVAKEVLVRQETTAAAAAAAAASRSRTATSSASSSSSSSPSLSPPTAAERTTDATVGHTPTTEKNTKKQKQNWFRENSPFSFFSSSAVSEEDIAAAEATHGKVRDDGLVAYPYDVLVLACGAARGVTGPLQKLFPPDQLDRHLVAVNPGVTRDNLSQLYEGNVVHIKVPPARLFQIYESARRIKAQSAGRGASEVSATRAYGTIDNPVLVPMITALESSAPAAAAAGGGSGSGGVCEDENRLDDQRRAARLFARLASVVPTGASWAAPPPPTTTETTLSGLSFFPYCHAARQLDSVFVSTTNLMWKYMTYFNKFQRCQLISVTADAEPLGPAMPPSVSNVVRQLWSSRQRQQRGDIAGEADVSPHVFSSSSLSSPSSSVLGEADERARHDLKQRFHVLTNSYVVKVDYTHRDVTLYNHHEDTYLKVPYRLLVLDLPLVAPAFIAASGLDRAKGASMAALSGSTRGLSRWWRREQARPPAQTALQHQHIANNIAHDACVDEDSFPDINPETLQHRRYEDIFAIGDVAGVPSVKSYGATFAQVPVVAHNIGQVLFNQQRAARLDAAAHPDTAHSPPSRRTNARYDGYTSFHVMMTPWRAMWPEAVYSDNVKAVLAVSRDDTTTTTNKKNNTTKEGVTEQNAPEAEGQVTTASPPSSVLDVGPYLRRVDHHLYNNLSWRGAGGCANGFFIQSSLYENAYFFLFSRGIWYPPHWFRTIAFDIEDGSEKPLGFI